MTQDAPAGWYPLPDGTQRYWDGTAWTDHTAPAVAAASPANGVSPGGTTDRPWWKMKRFIIPAVGFAALIILIMLGAVVAALGSSSHSKTPVASKPPAVAATSSPSPTAATTFTMPNVVGKNLQDAQDELQALGSLLIDQKDASGQGRLQVNDSNWTVCTQDPAAGVAAPIQTVVILASVKDDEVCPGDAKAALATSAAPAAPSMTVSQKQAVRAAENYLDYTAFSRSGLISQLEFEGYSNEDATIAVDSITVDWNEQAAKKAQNYLDMTSFSHSGLVDQLVFEGFTADQAEYGVTAVGL